MTHLRINLKTISANLGLLRKQHVWHSVRHDNLHTTLILTGDDHSSRSLTQQIVDGRLVGGTVNTRLHGGAEYTSDRPGTKLCRQLSNTTGVEYRTAVTATVHEHTHCHTTTDTIS